MGARRGAPGRSRAPIRGRAADGGQSGARLLFDGLLSLSTGSQLTTATFSVIRQQSHIWRQEEDAEKTPPITHTHKQQCAFPHFARHIWSPRRAPAVPGPCCCSCSPVKAHRVPRAEFQGSSSGTPSGFESVFCGCRSRFLPVRRTGSAVPVGAGWYDSVGRVHTQDDATHAGPELPPQWFPSGR